MTDKNSRDDAVVYLEHGKPLVFGKENDKGIRLSGTRLEVIELVGHLGPENCLVWDEDEPNPAIAFMVAQMGPPDFPTPIGVLRAVEGHCYDTAMTRV
jgi:2-oxoglutarate ferredoxin oxidoreductase subunit beta